MRTRIWFLLTLTLLASTDRLHAQGTAFTYQGQLQNNGSPASGTYNLTFSLFNVSSGGSAVAGPVTTNGVIVTNGLFTVLVDFGPGVFTGQTNWLAIGVETNGVSSFTTLNPRQELTPTPYAILANTASNLLGTLPAAQLSGTVPLARLSGISSDQFDAPTKAQLALAGTNLASVASAGLASSNLVAHAYAVPRVNFLRRPPMGFTTYPSGNSIYEGQVLTVASNMQYYGYVAAGYDILELEDGWGNTNRDAATGKLAWATNRFPNGLAWLNTMVRTNYGVTLGIYMEGLGESNSTVHPDSVNGSIPTTGFDNIERDANTVCGEWGISFVRMDWFSFNDWDTMRCYVERFCAAADYASKTNACPKPFVIQWYANLPYYWGNEWASPIPTALVNQLNVMRVGTDNESEMKRLFTIDFLKGNSYVVGPGHYLGVDSQSTPGVTGAPLSATQMQRDAVLEAMMSASQFFTWNGLASSPLQDRFPREAIITNTSLRDIRNDVLASPAVSIWTNVLAWTNWVTIGTNAPVEVVSTDAGELWTKALANGDYAVSLWNRDAVGLIDTNTITVANAVYTGSDPINGTYVFAWVTNVNNLVWTNLNGLTWCVNSPYATNTYAGHSGANWYLLSVQWPSAGFYYNRAALTNAITDQTIWVPYGGYVNQGNMIVYYANGLARSMSFGLTNLPPGFPMVFSWRDVLAQTNAVTTNSLTWLLAPDEARLFRVKYPGPW